MALRPVVVRRFCFTAKHAVKRNPLVSFLVVAGIFVLFCYLSSGSDEKQSHDVELPHGLNANQLVEAPTPLPGAPDPNTRFDNSKPGNYEPKEPEKVTNDRGERGEAAFPKDEEEKQQSQHAMREFGFNTVISDAIRMERTIPDIRPAECKYWNYPEDLPTVSVVIVFHNEGWSPLLRTVHSVVLRSPRHLLKQVVMVDDFSDKEHLGKKLEDYLERGFKNKVEVTLVRNKEREGLIRARTIGAQHATADVVLFLDAHCEVNVNWLPPLLAPIKYNKRVMTVPVIDGIDMNTWEYRSVYGSPDRHFRGIFEWGLLYKETEIPAQERADRTHDSQPFRSPTHAGGLFAINREWFKELGYYDPGLQIWGGEQYELSFKIWQCGGGILFVPCSHVGHVYRNHMPYGFGKLSGKPVISTNMLRVIRTWMDEYGDLYFIREPSAQHRTPGDISEQLELRKSLQCKSFDWFMKNVAYDVPASYPILPKNKVWGEAKNLATGKCLDTMGRAIPGTVGATPCHGYGGNQLIRLNEQGQMCQGEWCITPQGSSIKTGHCQKGTANGPFDYDKETQMITYKRGSTCLTADSSQGSSELLLKRCDKDNANQKWVWREIFTD